MLIICPSIFACRTSVVRKTIRAATLSTENKKKVKLQSKKVVPISYQKGRPNVVRYKLHFRGIAPTPMRS